MNNYFLNNLVSDWLIAIAIVLIGTIIIKVFKKGFLSKIKIWTQKTKVSIDDFLIEALEKSVIPLVYVMLVFSALKFLTFSEEINNVIHIAMLLVVTYYIILTLISALQYVILNYLRKQSDGETKQKQAGGLLSIVKIIIWCIGLVFLLDNLGYDVKTIIAGLGIGGIAIALAAQTILSDLFSYFVILFDRPFEIGDFIIVDDKMGVIEYIGIKTTRLKALSGEQLVCSNKDLTDSRVHNFKRMERRRVIFNLDVTYQTSQEALKQIPELIKNIITSQEETIFDRGHFSGFGDFSLKFEFVYFILSSDYTLYMDKQQLIYLEIVKEFENRGIEFAYPTQTLFLTREDRSDNKLNGADHNKNRLQEKVN